MESIGKRLRAAHRRLKAAEEHRNRATRSVERHDWESQIQQRQARANASRERLNHVLHAVAREAGEQPDPDDARQVAALLERCQPTTRRAYVAASEELASLVRYADETAADWQRIQDDAASKVAAAEAELASVRADAAEHGAGIVQRLSGLADAAEPLAEAIEGGLVADLADLNQIEADGLIEADGDAARAWAAIARVAEALRETSIPKRIIEQRRADDARAEAARERDEREAAGRVERRARELEAAKPGGE